MSKLILVGSTYFFGDYPDFKSKDKDFVKLVDSPEEFKYFRQTSGSYCLFEWKRMSVSEFIEYSLNQGVAILVGKFLVPEFVNEIGFKIEDLIKLKPLIDNLKKRHLYEKIIFDSYLENKAFALTDEQRLRAYENYKLSRYEV